MASCWHVGVVEKKTKRKRYSYLIKADLMPLPLIHGVTSILGKPAMQRLILTQETGLYGNSPGKVELIFLSSRDVLSLRRSAQNPRRLPALVKHANSPQLLLQISHANVSDSRFALYGKRSSDTSYLPVGVTTSCTTSSSRIRRRETPSRQQ